MPSNHLILCCSLLLLPLIFPRFRVFFNESALHCRWPKYWSFSFSTSPSNEYLGLISFRIDWFDLPGVQGTLKSLLQHHSSKAKILQCLAFFMVTLSHTWASLIAQLGKAGDPGSIPGSGRSPREGIGYPTPVFFGSPLGLAGKESACNVRDLGLIPGLGRSPGKGNGYPLQYSDLDNFMDCIIYSPWGCK